MAKKSDKLGGYNIDFLKTLDSRYKCSICDLALRSPFQTVCGHRFCEECIKDVITNGSKECPIDQSPLALNQIFKDVFCNNKMLEILCYCTNKALGCKWTGQMGEMERHYNECTKIKVPCPKMCGNEVVRDGLQDHLATECPKGETNFPNASGGVEYQGSRADLEKDMLEQKLGTQNDEMAVSKDDVAPLRPVIVNLEMKVAEVIRAAEEAEVPTRHLSPAMRATETAFDFESELKEIKQGHTHTAGPNSGSSDSGADDDTASLERGVIRMEHQHTLSEVKKAEHDVKISILEPTSYDGSYIWRVDELPWRINEAVTGRNLSIYSPPFYVGRFGYKVCACLCLNGDGTGKGSHVSLFFVVMRGSYDALLPWPFQQKVTFKLINQSSEQHIVDSFRPDPNSSSFQRPTANMNIASGFPLFVPNSVLNTGGYTKNGTMFFKITVDSSGIPNF